jgi:hypothetical protein
MAKSKKNSAPVTVLPGLGNPPAENNATPPATPTVDGARRFDDLTGAWVRYVADINGWVAESNPPAAPVNPDNATPPAENNATPSNVNPAAPAKAPAPVKVADAKASATLPEIPLSAKAQTLTVAFCATIATVLNMATERLAEWGKLVADIVATERETARDFGDKAFDSVMSAIADAYVARHPDTDTTPRVADWWKVAEFLRHCVALGIPGAERVSYKRIVNILFPATIEMVKKQATSTVREGWADWLKTVVPMLADGTMNTETLVASVDAQRGGLNAMDAKRFPMPKVTGAKALKKKTGAGRKAGKKKATPAPAAPAATNPPAAPSNPSNPPATPPAAPVNPVAVAMANLESFVKGLDATQYNALGVALATHATNDGIKRVYKAIGPRVRAITDAEKAQKASA